MATTFEVLKVNILNRADKSDPENKLLVVGVQMRLGGAILGARVARERHTVKCATEDTRVKLQADADQMLLEDAVRELIVKVLNGEYSEVIEDELGVG